jgi:hypothetical protein
MDLLFYKKSRYQKYETRFKTRELKEKGFQVSQIKFISPKSLNPVRLIRESR